MRSWRLVCSARGEAQPGNTLASLCPKCGQPFLVEYDSSDSPKRDALRDRWDMWRYASLLPLGDDESPISLGEGGTPLLDAPAIAADLGVARVWIKDEGLNPTG